MPKANLVQHHPKKSGRLGGYGLIKHLHEAGAGFPSFFLALLNAKTVKEDQNDEHSSTLTFGYAAGSPLNSLLGRSSPRGHVFSDDEIAEQQELLNLIERHTAQCFAFQPTAGHRHLCVLPLLIAYLRESTDWMIGHGARGPWLTDRIAGFRRQARFLLNRKNTTLDLIHTSANCLQASWILERFADVPFASLRLVYRCENPECRHYLIRTSIRPAHHCPGRKCRERHRYLRARNQRPA